LGLSGSNTFFGFILLPVKIRFAFPISNWPHFLLFLTANALLAFGPFSLACKIWIGLAALLTAILISAGTPAVKPGAFHPAVDRELVSKEAARLALLFIGVGIFFRFYGLTTLSTWPTPDESFMAAIAFHISRHWDWHFFYGNSQTPFPYFWIMALGIKALGLSLTTLWLVPAVFSCLTLPLFYLAARQLLSSGPSLVATAFAGLSFWGLYASRIGYSHPALATPVELLALILLMRAAKETPQGLSWRTAALLASVLSLGFYVYPPAWLPLALLILATFLSLNIGRKGNGLFPIVVFLSFLSAALLAFAFCAFREHYGIYLNHIKWSFSSPVEVVRQLLSTASYVTGLFWGKMPGDYYGPYWGGLLDPLTGALFFLGLLQAWKERRDVIRKWVGAGIILTLLPGMLSSSLEFLRVFLLFPFLILVAFWGFQALCLSLKPSRRSWFTGFVLAGMAAFNLYHLLGPYQHHWENPGPSWGFYKSVENARAYRILTEAARELGPGYIFQNFPSDMAHQSLTVASCPFNLAINPSAGHLRARWFAVLANDNYGPFLLRRFPGGRWFQLSGGMNRIDGGLGLGVFPLSSIPPEALKTWVNVNNAFGETAYSFLNRPTGADYSGPLETLLGFQPLMRGDKFLESCFWEKAYYLYLQNSLFGDQQKWRNFEGSFQAIQQALGQGYPAAHLLNEYGTCLMLLGRYAEARKTFQDASRENPAFSPAAANLELLRHR
jgi:hypothetical protein